MRARAARAGGARAPRPWAGSAVHSNSRVLRAGRRGVSDKHAVRVQGPGRKGAGSPATGVRDVLKGWQWWYARCDGCEDAVDRIVPMCVNACLVFWL